MRRKNYSGNSCENLDDFRIDLEDDDETSEEYLDEKEAREEDVEKVIKGDEDSMETSKVFMNVLFSLSYVNNISLLKPLTILLLFPPTFLFIILAIFGYLPSNCP